MEQHELYDVIIIGGGPAGLTAALYLARARYRVLVIEKEKFGGQITITSEVVNYPGVMRDSGTAITETMRKQAQAFGAEFLLAEAEALILDEDIKTVRTTRGTLKSFGLLVATGANPRMVGFEGEADFRGHGVAYCATCDGEFFTGLEVFVVGGGFAAAEESVFLTKYASHVTVLVREEDFTCAQAVADEVRSHPKITVLYHHEMVAVGGDHALRYARYKNNLTGEITEFRPADQQQTFGVFVFAGYEPATALVKELVELNNSGYIVTDRQQKTNLEGVYAAGDICIKNLRQVVTAVGDGAIAATELERYAAAMHVKLKIIPQQPKMIESSIKTGDSNTSEVQAEGLFSAEIKSQLAGIFERMEQPLILRLCLDDRDISKELHEYMKTMAALTDKLTVEVIESDADDQETPVVKLIRADGKDTGIAFHGVPGGHEFNSFVIGLYNAAGPGQSLETALVEDIALLQKPTDLKILVSLSCTMCPELVMAAQKIAATSPWVTAHVYDLNHFPALKDQFQVMSVPCLVMNDTAVSFGKKNVRQLLDFILA